MNKEDIIRMAREAGATWVHGKPKEKVLVGNDAIERFFQAAYDKGRTDEHEAIKQVAERELDNTLTLASVPPKSSATWNILQAIRARGQA